VVDKLSISDVPSKIYRQKLMRHSLNIAITYLYDGLFTLDLQNLTLSNGTISKSDVDNFCIFGELDIVKNNQWSFDIENSSVIDSRGNVVVGGDGLEVLLECFSGNRHI